MCCSVAIDLVQESICLNRPYYYDLNQTADSSSSLDDDQEVDLELKLWWYMHAAGPLFYHTLPVKLHIYILPDCFCHKRTKRACSSLVWTAWDACIYIQEKDMHTHVQILWLITYVRCVTMCNRLAETIKYKLLGLFGWYNILYKFDIA